MWTTQAFNIGKSRHNTQAKCLMHSCNIKQALDIAQVEHPMPSSTIKPTTRYKDKNKKAKVMQNTPFTHTITII